jgi:molybdate transport system substrate-binding protein
MGGTGRAGVWAVGSVAAAVGLVAALAVREHSATPADGRPLVVYAAASLRPAFTRIAADYETQTGQRVELRFGASEEMLTRVRLPAAADPGDLFAPADESYVTAADKFGLIAESRPVARMRGVLLLAPSRPPPTAWGDLASRDMRVSLANESAAIGRLTRQRLIATGLWRELEPRVRGAATVTDSANAAKLGAVDAAIVWDAVARQYPDQQTVELPELAGIEAEVRVAVLKQSARPADADHFLRFVIDPEHGLKHFRDLGFRVVE